MEDWNTKYNSELTTIKNKQFIAGWTIGFIVGCLVVVLVWKTIG